MSEVESVMKVCNWCAKWKCASCGKERPYQNPKFHGVRKCGKCGGPKGELLPMMHRPRKWRGHQEEFEFEERIAARKAADGE